MCQITDRMTNFSGVDVDKWDYFMRDDHHLSTKNATFDYQRFIHFTTIKRVGPYGRLRLCLRDKEGGSNLKVRH